MERGVKNLLIIVAKLVFLFYCDTAVLYENNTKKCAQRRPTICSANNLQTFVIFAVFVYLKVR